MNEQKSPQKVSRQYPPIYEKIVPIALAAIGVVVIIILVITVGVALRAIPGA